MYVCMYVQNERVCHTISGLKCCIRRTPPHLLEAPKTCGGGIFHVVRWNISQKFLALPPPNIPGLKGGDQATLQNHAWRAATRRVIRRPRGRWCFTCRRGSNVSTWGNMLEATTRPCTFRCQHSEGMCRHRRGGCRTHSVEGVHVQPAVLQWACIDGLATSKKQPKSSKKQQVETPVGRAWWSTLSKKPWKFVVHSSSTTTRQSTKKTSKLGSSRLQQKTCLWSLRLLQWKQSVTMDPLWPGATPWLPPKTKAAALLCCMSAKSLWVLPAMLLAHSQTVGPRRLLPWRSGLQQRVYVGKTFARDLHGGAPGG